MPYIFVTTLIRLVMSNDERVSIASIISIPTAIYYLQETGPTRVGDKNSDPRLMRHLDAELLQEPGSPL